MYVCIYIYIHMYIHTHVILGYDTTIWHISWDILGISTDATVRSDGPQVLGPMLRMGAHRHARQCCQPRQGKK